MSTLPSQKSVTTCNKLLQMEQLGEDVSELTGGFHLDQAHLAVLNRLVREMLANIYVLGPFPSVITWLPHSIQAVLSSYTGVSGACSKPMFASRLQRYNTSIAISKAE